MLVVRAAAAAVAFLTIVPVGRAVALGPADVARGAAFFPLVGAGVGAAVGAVAVGLAGPLPALAAAALAVATGAVLTGAMHLDALADTADALGARSRAAALQIMRDPRTGSFGAVALTLDLLAKASALATGGVVLPALVAGAASRATAPALALALPAARTDGSGAELVSRSGPTAAVIAAALALAVGVAAAGRTGLAVCATAVVGAAAVGLVARLRFGGVTGDVLGAAVELAETAGLLVAVALA